METIFTVDAVHSLVRKLKREGKSVGFVPTMGFLHKGHISLVNRSKSMSDVTIVSIFVNPSQFGPNEDFNRYPRDIERDKSMLTEAGADYIFMPEASEIYPPGFQTYVDLNEITKEFEGGIRPGHFRGVATVVSILFNCVQPDYAFFGQKDAQQAALIKQMVKDLKYDINIVVCPIEREPDGLAMSSRNIYLSGLERKQALALNRALTAGAAAVKEGLRDVSELKKMMTSYFTEEGIKYDYLEIVSSEAFLKAEGSLNPGRYYILTAARIGTTRLIDNVLIEIKG